MLKVYFLLPSNQSKVYLHARNHPTEKVYLPNRPLTDPYYNVHTLGNINYAAQNKILGMVPTSI